MSPNPSHRRAPRSSRGLLLGLFLLVAAVGIVLTLHAVGTITLPFLKSEEQVAVEKHDRGPAPGRIRVPISGRPIAAYDAIQRDDLWDPKRGRIATVDLSKEVVEKRGILADLGKLIGRVLAREKAPGYVFTESDFLPRGTRPGLVGGIPPGKRALRFEAEQVQGLVGLRPGDRFDLLASMAVEVEPGHLGSLSDAGARGAELVLRARLAAQRQQGEIRVLVQNGVVVSPVTTRNVPVSTTSLTRGRTTRTKPVQEVVIAVAPEELGPLYEALATGATVVATPRSGHPDDPQDSVTPDYRSPWMLDSAGGGAGKNPTDDFRMMEVLEDGKLKVVPVPAARDPEKGK